MTRKGRGNHCWEDSNIFKPQTVTKSPRQTAEFAEEFAENLRPGDVVALEGELGAGKTCFAQGLGWGLGIDRNTYLTSPTFTIIKEYRGKTGIFHIDLYRVEGPQEALDAGCGEYMGSDGVCIIEWPEKLAGLLKGERIFRITIEILSENERKITIRAGD